MTQAKQVARTEEVHIEGETLKYEVKGQFGKAKHRRGLWINTL